MFRQVGSAIGRFSTATPPGGGSGQGVEFVGISYASVNPIAIPAGVKRGDLLVALLGTSGTVAAALPAGFTLITIAANPGGTGRILACYRIADGTEAPVSQTTQGVVLAYRNARGIGEVAKIELATASTAQPIATLPKVSEGSLIAAACYNSSHTDVAAPGLWPMSRGPIIAATSVSPAGNQDFQAQGAIGGTFVSSSSFAHVTMTLEVLAA